MFKQLSKSDRYRLKKELETSLLSDGPSTNLNWDESNEGNSCLEREYSNLDYDSVAVVSSSKGNYNRYLDINKDNSALLDYFSFLFDLPRKFQ